ncbi:MAG: amidohydrolase family protein [bacterium]|nr:amidohydrolase family protein [bacterium]
MTPVIDFHLHPVVGDTYHPWVVEWMREVAGPDLEDRLRALADPGAFVAFLEASGVDRGVVLAEMSPITTGTISNEDVARFCRGRDRLIPFCSLNPYLIADPAAELERLAGEFAFRGIKLYPTYQLFYPNEAMLYPLYARAEALGLPVMVHTGSSVFRGSRLKYGDPLYLDDVAVDFPRLTILLVHGGRGFWYDRAFFLARLHPNVYLEIAGLPPRKLLVYYPELERLAGKVVFGSDWPGVPDIRGNLEAIRSLPLAPDTVAAILGGNAARILDRKGRPVGD